MKSKSEKKPTVAVLTGGGDVPGLNPCIKALVYRAASEGMRVLGIRRGWGGLLHYNPDDPESLSNCIEELVPDEDLSNIDDKEKIRDQIELDSMDFLDIIMELRKRYGINVPEDDYPHFITLEGCMNYLEPTLKDR